MSTLYAGYQDQIYRSGTAGRRPPFTTDHSRLERAARDVMAPQAYGYIAGAAGSEATMRANRAAFDHHGLVPRVLRDVSERDLSIELFGSRLPTPLLLAPVGALGLAHPDGEIAAARAAEETGVPLVLSTVSSHSIEEVAAAAPRARRWFQLYWPNDTELTLSLLERAVANRYEVLVVTLDAFALAWRPRDLDRGYLPFHRLHGLANYLTDPAFRHLLPKPAETDPAGAVQRWSELFNDASRTWASIPFLREHWHGPLVLKGICHPGDARAAVDSGADAIVVSNHGGRQIDGGVAALDALEAVVAAVGDRTTVLFDSGIRTGADTVKALALGARAVLLGRPYVYGLALGGTKGVIHVLRGLLAELDLTLAMTGHRTPAALDPSVLVRT
ncbi:MULTISPECIES: alpha-hydroxy-acid oxidizing protein [Streptomyces]|uniref:Alpha-hydroxy-acid oxidizing enzyme n=1 Tax=Streptomyces tsukubensis (strain DSM 42081 / NBRC 108919 / NRRL 18488 / 9993) TaxID=1114943 RepID=I2NB42_STRT9|nr:MULTISPECIES: alpha-hydroxy-acid oxidizing protein [Streptomyces]AZK97986.1 alpha-hydroxy-acid oxidizing enzyme [Streptomyces tsukubensis]EIF94239.1 alpha-hydroxyacid dehydrogenase, FMN-dependent L-lactate dehydrogenase [Streptomyces tsukubensis NRRL18488]MYS64440.1 alpha-hydroxy-acid oxidizing protein [Streptomyces sp. SID5473]QKM66090.1 alpha-hydroxy-acid oxidizing enzyme [Streptomyces tsukubensis NRRL18488]TAI42372.1 alpha-hydroxy-acid oxidizing protein [Streptomyces tsukubensis]